MPRRRIGWVNCSGCALLPSPLVGEGGSPRSGETGEGCLSASHLSYVGLPKQPLIRRASRATFSHKGRREEAAAPRVPDYSDIGLSEMSQSLPVKVEMNSVFIGV